MPTFESERHARPESPEEDPVAWHLFVCSDSLSSANELADAALTARTATAREKALDAVEAFITDASDALREARAASSR